ncbi:MAG: general secretion pathway protein GspK [Tepidisphaeraceae bacterium]
MTPNPRQRGTVLIIAMVILFAITALVLTLNRQARTQAQASANDLASQQADAIERGAERYALSLVTDYRTTLNQLTDQDFAAVPVGTGYFWIVRPNYGDDTQSTFGLMDESSKINLNTVTADSLAAVPGMTDDIAGAIVDWRDADDTLSPNGGAETSTYAAMSTPYNAKNSNFESVGEMLLLNGMTRELMYGDPNATSSSADDYYLSHGLADYFTVWSTQSTTAADGTTRVSISDATQNQQLRQLLTDKISAARANQIMNLAYPTVPPGTRGATDIFQLAARSNMTEQEFQSIEDYVTSTPDSSTGTSTSTGGAGSGSGSSNSSGSGSSSSGSSSSTDTTTTATGPVGLINVNTAPKAVLMTLLGISNTTLAESDIDALIAARPGPDADNPTSMSWVLSAIADKNKLTGLGNYITGSGGQYSAEIVSVSGNGRGFRHVKIVIDTTVSPPRIVYRHDITDHGWPFDPQLLATLRSGQGITQGTTQGASLVSGGIH